MSAEKALENIENRMFSITQSGKQLQGEMQGLAKVVSKLNDSDGLGKTWGIISRMSSGIFPNFWSIQNKVRAVTVIFDKHYKKQREQVSKQIESITALENLQKIPQGLDIDHDSLRGGALNQHFNKMKGQIEEFASVEKMYKSALKQDKLSDDVKKLLLSNMKGQVKPTARAKKELEDRTKKGIERQLEFKKLAKDRGISEDSPFGRLRLKALRLQFKVNKTFSKIKAFDYLNLIKGAGKFFFKALLAFSAIVLGLFFLKKSFDLLKEPLGEAFESIKEQVMWVLGGIFNTLSDLGSAFVLLYDGFANGEFFTVIDALLQIFAGVFKLGLQVLGGIIWLGVSSIVIVLGELLEHAVSSSTNFYNTLTGILLAVGVLAGYLVFIGSTIAALPYLIVAGIAGVIMLGLKNIIGFSTGGIVNSDMQIVGERGAELVSLPRGSRVHSNADSKRMVSGSGGNTINVHVNGRVGASDAEIRDIANKVAREINLRMSRTGSGVNNF